MKEHPVGAWIRWGNRWGRLILVSLVVATVAGQPATLQASYAARAPDFDVARPGPEALDGMPASRDPVYDQFLRRFRNLQENPARRHYLIREVLAAANQNHIDPDLLFALVAVESDFNSTARSSKGARGLGQIMYPTVHSVAPDLVRRPADLYNVSRNLSATALLLRRLLIQQEGDLQAALAAYHLGPGDGHLPRRTAERYVGRICTYFASLKARREFRELVAMKASDSGSRSVEN